MSDSAYDQLMASLPSAVRIAIEAVDLEAFQCAMDDLPTEQAQLIVQQLEAAGIIGIGPASEAEYQAMLQEFDLLIQAIVSAAQGDYGQQEQVAAVLPRLDSAGYHLGRVIPQIWAGERNFITLTLGLDPNSARLVEHILTLLDGSPEAAELECLISKELPRRYLLKSWQRSKSRMKRLFGRQWKDGLWRSASTSLSSSPVCKPRQIGRQKTG